jgi:hypothetical protein
MLGAELANCCHCSDSNKTSSMSDNKQYNIGKKYHDFGMDYLGDVEYEKDADDGWLSPLRPSENKGSKRVAEDLEKKKDAVVVSKADIQVNDDSYGSPVVLQGGSG